MKILSRIFWVIVALAVIAVGAVAVIGRETTLEALFGPIDRSKIDFAALSRSDTENDYLVCPADLCQAAADKVSPVFDMPVDTLKTRWQTMAMTQPRVEAAEAYPDENQFDFIQRSDLLRYPDTVTVRFIALDNDTSTLAIYSRAHYGRRDFGVNRERVETWLAALDRPE